MSNRVGALVAAASLLCACGNSVTGSGLSDDLTENLGGDTSLGGDTVVVSDDGPPSGDGDSEIGDGDSGGDAVSTGDTGGDSIGGDGPGDSAGDGDVDGGDTGGGDPAGGDGDAGPQPDNDPPPRIPTTFTRVSDATQSALAGAAVASPPEVEVRDQDGLPLADQVVAFAVDSGGGTISTTSVSTDATGRSALSFWKLGKSVVPNRVTAELAATPGLGTIDFDATVSTSFTVTIQVMSSMTASQLAAFEDAAARWAAVVTNDLSDFSFTRAQISTTCFGEAGNNTPINVDDMIIFAAVQPIDGPGQVLAQAGPCYVHDDSGATAIGMMQFDSDDIVSLEAKGYFDETVLHEMGHVIGIGTYWSAAYANLLDMPSLPSSPGVNTTFTGPLAAAAFVQIGGTGFAPGHTPVENDAVAGSADGHWRESVFGNELMTPYLTGMELSLPLSVVSAASLADLGFYTVNMLAADGFSLPLSLQTLRIEGPPPPPSCQILQPIGVLPR